MLRWVVGRVRCALGASLLLLLLLCGAEVAVRLFELRSPRLLSPQGSRSPLATITVPSWSTHQELRPHAQIQVTTPGDSAPHVVRTNSFGLRGPEVEVPKPPDVYRVLCLGDERALGAHWDEDAVWCAHLQTQLQQQTKLQVEVWNGGVPGACPLTQFLLLTHRLASLQPDLVLAAVQADDLADDTAYRRYTRTDAAGSPLSCRHPSLGKKPRVDKLTSWREEFRLIDLGLRWAGDTWKKQTEVESSFDTDSAAPDLSRLKQDRPTIERTLQPLAALANWCRNSHVALCVFEVREPLSQGESTEPALFTTILQDMAGEQKFQFVELERIAETKVRTRRNVWSMDEHHRFSQQLADRILAATTGPWSSPYFRTEPRPIAPISHQENNASVKRR